MNKQPFYHDVQLLFTGVGKMISEEQISRIEEAVVAILDEGEFIDIDFFWNEPEPGDPADLM